MASRIWRKSIQAYHYGLVAILICQLMGKCYSQRCSGDSCFYFYSTPVTWSQAEQSCRSRGRTLAPATDDLINILWSNSDLGRLPFWTDQRSQPDWHWFDNKINAGFATISFNMEGTGCGYIKWNAWTRSHSLKPGPCSQSRGFICETDHPLECTISRYGQEYRGTKAQGNSRITCAPWVDSNRHFNNKWRFPDASPEHAKNYCRNPDNSTLGLWCRMYSTHNPNALDKCNVESCVRAPNSCFKSDDISYDSVWCTEQKCYVFISPSISGPKTWHEATSCCKALTTGRLASVDTFHQGILLAQTTLKKPEEEFWMGLTNGNWNPDVTVQDKLYCPYLERGFTDQSNKECNHRQGFVCRSDYITTTTTKATTTTTRATTTTTTRRPTTTTTRSTTTSTTTTTRRPTTTTTTSTTTTRPTTTTTRYRPPVAPPKTTTTTHKIPLPPQPPAISSSSSSSLSTTTTTYERSSSTMANGPPVVSAQASLLEGDNVIYLGIGIGVVIVIIVVLLVVLLIFCRGSKDRPKPIIPSRERTTSGTQTFVNGDFDSEYIVGAPNGAPVPRPSTSTGPATSTRPVQPASRTRKLSQKPLLERSGSAESGTQTDLTPVASSSARDNVPLPLPPKENVYNSIYDKPRPLTCRPL